FFCPLTRPPHRSPPFPYTTLFRSRVPGIAQVTVFGAGQYAMRLWVKPAQLATLNITVPEIISAVNNQNTVNPAGRIGGLPVPPGDRKSTRLNSSHVSISYAVFCLK